MVPEFPDLYWRYYQHTANQVKEVLSLPNKLSLSEKPSNVGVGLAGVRHNVSAADKGQFIGALGKAEPFRLSHFWPKQVQENVCA